MGNRYVPTARDAEGERDRIERTHGCLGKVRYPSKRVAKGVLRVMVKREGSGTLGEYHCRICGNWHLGNSERNRRLTIFHRDPPT